MCILCITSLQTQCLNPNIAQQAFKFGLHWEIEYKFVNIYLTSAEFHMTSNIAQNYYF